MKKSRKNIFSKGLSGILPGAFLALFISTLFLSFCTSCAPDEPRKRKRSRYAKTVFRPLKDYSLVLLHMTSKTIFLPEDDDARITFALRNTGLKPVTIKEWRMNESSNVKIWYAPGKISETKNIPFAAWKSSRTFDPADKYVNMHNPLILNPSDNWALIDVPLTFIKQVRHAGQRQYFTIIAELNLTSVKVKSAPVEITVK